jgi:hypothetical protein
MKVAISIISSSSCIHYVINLVNYGSIYSFWLLTFFWLLILLMTFLINPVFIIVIN